jgi:2-amino-4-deoxychorismate synthase
MNPHALFDRILSGNAPPFALFQRPAAHGSAQIEILMGETCSAATLADIPLSERQTTPGQAQHDVLVLVPHRQIAERGFEAVDDGTPLLVLKVREQGQVSRARAFELLPDDPITLENEGFDIADDAYVGIVRDVLENEIGTGAGSNFVIKRAFVADIPDYSLRTALSLFRRLLQRETGAYWTFVVHTGDRTLVGATPERHVSLRNGRAVMNPISGTYRYPPGGVEPDDIQHFLDDRKETEELYMVLDEELKMMAHVCDGGGQVTGPFLREMAHLAHTEYYIEGDTAHDPRDILRSTLLAPTVTGSPLENACRVIARYEPKGRGYYGGVAALIGREAGGARCMDSAILIRTADFTRSLVGGCHQIAVSVGATLVRHSDAGSEVAETRTKASGVLTALKAPPQDPGQQHGPVVRPMLASRYPQIHQALSRRNATISGFWMQNAQTRAVPRPQLAGQRALVVDAEDDFTAMLAVQLRAVGLGVDLRSCRGDIQPGQYDVVVMGPGPGDPRDMDDPRIARMAALTGQLLSSGHTPFLSVCLSHQILCRRLGLQLRRRPLPNQGTQMRIDLFGEARRVGFYNSFAAYADTSQLHREGIGRVDIARTADTGEVHALKGPHFASVQFHLESVLTETGLRILTDLLTPIMTTRKALA